MTRRDGRRLLVDAGVALGAPAVAFGVAFAAGLQGKPGPLAIVFFAVLFASLLAGPAAGLVAAAVSYVPLVYFFLKPLHSFTPGVGRMITVAALFAGAIVASLVVERARRSRAAAIDALEEQQRLARSLAASEGRLVRTLEETETASWQWDLRSSKMIWSDNFARIHGLEAARPPRRYEDYLAVIHPDDRDRLAAAVEEALERSTGFEVELRTLPSSAEGESRWIWTQASAISNARGRRVRMVGIARDVTGRKRREEATELLAAASDALAASLDHERTLGEIARLAVPRLADWCSVELVDADGVIRSVAVAHADPEKQRYALELQARYPSDPSASAGVANVLRTGRPELYAEIPDELVELACQDEAELALVRGLGLRSAMIVPLRSRDEILGAITFVTAETPRRYDPTDLAFAEELARRMSLALDNARAHKAEQLARAAAEQGAMRMERLQRLSARLSAAATPAQIGRILVHEGRRALDASAGWVSVLSDDGDVLELLACDGYRDDFVERYREIPLASGHVAAEVVRSGEPFWHESTVGDPRRELRDAEEATGAEAVAIVPLRTPEGPLGFMALRFAGRRAFTTDEQRLFLTMAHQCSLALQRADLLEAERRARQLATRLQPVTSALAAAADRSQVAQVILDETLPALDADACELYALEAEALVELGARERTTGARPLRRGPATEPDAPVAEAVERRELVVEPSGAAETDAVETRVCAPLLIGDRVLGALRVAYVGRRFGPVERELLERLAVQSARALDRAELYERERNSRRAAQRATERLVRVQAMTAALAKAITVQEVTQIIVDQGSAAFEADAAAVYLVAEDATELMLSAEHGYEPEQPASAALAVDEANAGADAVRRRKIAWFESNDALAVRFPAHAASRSGWQAIGVIPLVGRAGALGLLVLEFRRRRRQRQEDRALLATLGRQCGQALERAQLSERERTTRQWLRRLQEVTAALSGVASVEEVGETVIDRALETFGSPAGVVALVDRQGRLRQLAAGGDSATGGSGASVDTFPIAEAVRESRTVVRARETVTAVGVPLLVGARAIGGIGFQLPERDDLTEPERDFLGALARQAAQAVERALLYEDEQLARQAAERANERLRKLEAVAQVGLAARRLGGLLDELLPLVRDLFGADRAELLLVDEERGEIWMRAAAGLPEDDRATSRMPIGRGIAGRIAATGRAMLIDDVLAAEPESPYLRRRGGSLLGVPLKADGRVIGVLHVTSDRTSAFEERDLRLLTLAGERIALALERISLYEREHETAVTLQRSVLPERMPEVERIQLAARYVPGSTGLSVGGDWYDAIELGPSRLGVAVGDVVGKGVLAAATMTQLRNALRVYALEGLKPSSVLARLNRLVDVTGPSFATLLYAVIDTEALTCRYASAGHPPPLLVSGSTRTSVFLEGGRSVPLGAHSEVGYRQQLVRLRPGDTLLLYTDGLVERREATLDEGLERFRAVTEKGPDELEALLDHLLEELLAAGASADDVAVLGIRALPLPARRLELALPAEPASLAEVRTSLRDWLLGTGVPDPIGAEIVLACSEACANAVEHAQAPSRSEFRVAAEKRGDDVLVRVRDFGRWRAPQARADRGYGFALIEELMDAVEVERSEAGTEVTLRRRVGARAPVAADGD